MIRVGAGVHCMVGWLRRRVAARGHLLPFASGCSADIQAVKPGQCLPSPAKTKADAGNVHPCTLTLATATGTHPSTG